MNKSHFLWNNFLCPHISFKKAKCFDWVSKIRMAWILGIYLKCQRFLSYNYFLMVRDKLRTWAASRADRGARGAEKTVSTVSFIPSKLRTNFWWKGIWYKIIQLNSNSYHFFWQNTEEKLAQCSSFGNLFLLLFSITDRSSFEEIERLGRFIRETKTHGEYSIVLVGTKRDLRDYRAVSEDEGHVVANKLGGTYFEISSADSYEGIERLFSYSIKSHLKARFFDPERNRRVMGLKKLRDGLLLRTKSLYRSRGMTF